MNFAFTASPSSESESDDSDAVSESLSESDADEELESSEESVESESEDFISVVSVFAGWFFCILTSGSFLSRKADNLGKDERLDNSTIVELCVLAKVGGLTYGAGFGGLEGRTPGDFTSALVVEVDFFEGSGFPRLEVDAFSAIFGAGTIFGLELSSSEDSSDDSESEGDSELELEPEPEPEPELESDEESVSDDDLSVTFLVLLVATGLTTLFF